MKKTSYIFLILIFVLAACKTKTIQLQINSNKDSSIVYINDNMAGYTPLITTINQGLVNVKVKKDGFEDFVFSDSLYTDSIFRISAILYTKEELEIIKQKEQEEELFKTQTSGYFTDFRENKKYKWIKIGQQIWMAENLAFNAKKSWAYDNNTKYIKDYGFLYDWISAQEACPQGWHIPTEKEWNQLIVFLGGDNKASEKIRERGFLHWVDGYYYRPIATNESGFTARPGGQRNDKGEFITIGTYANFWSSTETNVSEGVCFWLGYMGDYLSKDTRAKSFGLSVRCVKD